VFLYFRYASNLVEAKSFGIRKGVINGTSMGVVFFIMFGSYALAFWYGSQLVMNKEYTAGQVLIVSINN
jgi:ABC-type bacteriocin/lantibiotic exporter with double-glycine peptidase domain